VSYKKQESLTRREHQVSSRFFGGVPVAHLFMFYLVGPYYVSLRSEFRVVMSVAMFGSPLPPVVCESDHVLFECNGVRRMSCCVFALLFFVLCTLCCHFICIVHF
jgi:hypothetical protein